MGVVVTRVWAHSVDWEWSVRCHCLVGRVGGEAETRKRIAGGARAREGTVGVGVDDAREDVAEDGDVARGFEEGVLVEGEGVEIDDAGVGARAELTDEVDRGGWMDAGEHETVLGGEARVAVAELKAEEEVSGRRHGDGVRGVFAGGEEVAEIEGEAKVGLAHGVGE